jgi:hypothetical protein
MSSVPPDSADSVAALADRFVPDTGRRTVLLALGAVALAVELLTFGRLVLGADRPPMTPDAAVFQHAGWYLTEGGALYLDVWEPKLPLSYQTTAVLSTLAGGDPLALHLLSTALTMAAAVGTVVLVGLLAHRLTDDVGASVLAGLSLFVLPGFAVRPVYGYKAKYLVLFVGLLCLWLALDDRPFAAGLAGAAAVGYWQLGAVFPLVALGLARHDRRAMGQVVAGGVALTVAMLAPVAASGALEAMVVQTLVVPLSLPESAPLLERVLAGGYHFRWGTPFVAAGAVGLALLARDHRRRAWWVLVPAAWFAAVVFFVDFETGGYTDLVPGLAFVALGLGVLVARLRDARLRRGVHVAVAAVVCLNVLAFGGLGVAFGAVDTPTAEPMADLATVGGPVAESPYVGADAPTVRHYFWTQSTPETCHYRWSGMELDWLAYTDGRDACRSGDATGLLDEWRGS